jgi:hypothetical protein
VNTIHGKRDAVDVRRTPSGSGIAMPASPLPLTVV